MIPFARGEPLKILAIAALRFFILATILFPPVALGENRSGPTTDPVCEKSLAIFEWNSTQGRFYSPQLPGKPGSVLNSALSSLAFRVSGLFVFNQRTRDFLSDRSDDPYFVRLARAFGLSVNESNDVIRALEQIPRSGPLVFTLNHPLNGSEGIAVAALLARARPDIKIVLTHMLADYPGMKEAAFFLNPYGGAKAREFNRKALADEIIPHLKNGGSIMIFPAGDVSDTLDADGRPIEKEWQPGIVKILDRVRNTKVIPVFVAGTASPQFYRFREWTKPGGSLSPLAKLSPLMHSRELGKNMGRKIDVVLGGPADVSALSHEKIRIPSSLRSMTLALQGRNQGLVSAERQLSEIWNPSDESSHLEQVARQIKALDQAPLGPGQGVQIFLVDGASHAPDLWNELGRRREHVFRSIGEGSGLSLDLDSYDKSFQHLIAFDSRENRLLGSYRMGRLDELARQGLKGYTNDEFEYSAPLSQALSGQGLEFGRSFVDKSAGRQSGIAFAKIWRRIGAFLADNSHYRYLIGPVSLSNTYSPAAKRIMVEFLRRKFGPSQTELSARPQKNYEYFDPLLPAEAELVEQLHSLDDLNTAIQAIDGERIPPLLSIYANLGAEYLSFAFDPGFNTVDGMILIDLWKMKHDPRLREEAMKYFGQEGLDRYLNAR